MTDSNDTPSTEEVRAALIEGRGYVNDELFDRWLAQVRTDEALRIADDLDALIKGQSGPGEALISVPVSTWIRVRSADHR